MSNFECLNGGPFMPGVEVTERKVAANDALYLVRIFAGPEQTKNTAPVMYDEIQRCGQPKLFNQLINELGIVIQFVAKISG